MNEYLSHKRKDKLINKMQWVQKELATTNRVNESWDTIDSRFVIVSTSINLLIWREVQFRMWVIEYCLYAGNNGNSLIMRNN